MPKRVIVPTLLIAFALATAACTQSTPALREGLAADLLKNWAAPRWEGEGKLHVPAADASDEETLAFWTGDLAETGGSAEIGGLEIPPGADLTLTPRLREKILRGALAQPRFLPQVLRKLPETPAAFADVHDLYFRMQANAFADLPDGWRDAVHDWLMRHRDFPGELIAAAKLANYNDGEIEHYADLRALSELNWPAAEPLLRTFLADKDSHLAAAATVLFFNHAQREKSADAAGWREKLQAIAADKAAASGSRDLALGTLFSQDWPGQEDWAVSLVGDSSILTLERQEDYFTSPLLAWLRADPRHMQRVARLLDNPDADLRTSAAIALLRSGDDEAFKILLAHRSAWPVQVAGNWIAALQRSKFPGSADFLLDYINATQGAARLNAAIALSLQDPPKAIPFLRHSLDQPEEIEHGDRFAAALVRSNVLTDDEWYRFINGNLWPALSKAERITSQYFDVWSVPGLSAHEELAARLVAQLREEKDAAAAKSRWEDLGNWPAAAVDAEIVRRLADEPLDSNLVELALGRPQLAARQPVQLRKLTETSGERAGIAAAILNDDTIMRRILSGPDGPAAQMLLAYARLKPVKLPLNAVAPLLSSKDTALARAAEAFLLVDDSSEARRLVRQHHAGTLIIIGSGQIFPDPNPPSPGVTILSPNPEDLRREMLAPNPPDEIFALFSGGGWGGDGDRIIRVRGTKATFSYDVGNGKHFIHELSAQELQSLRDLIARQNIDSLPPLRNDAVFDGISYDYVHLTPHAGNMLTMNNPGMHGTQATPYDLITRRFRDFSPANAATSYDLQFANPGTRVLFQNNKAQIREVAMRDGILLVYISGDDKPTGWHAFVNGQIGESVPELDPSTSLISLGNTNIADISLDWPRIGTPDGKWIVAGQRPEADRVTRLIRINRATQEKTPFNLPADRAYSALAYLPPLKKILIGTVPNDTRSDKYYLADPDTLSCQPIAGDFGALLEWQGKPAQSAGTDTIWITRYDRNTRETLLLTFNLQTLQFETRAHLPEVYSSASEGILWVDAPRHKFYLAINGDLLEVPLR